MLVRETTVSVKSLGISPFRNCEVLPHDLRTNIHALGGLIWGIDVSSHCSTIVRFAMRIQKYTVKLDFALW